MPTCLYLADGCVLCLHGHFYTTRFIVALAMGPKRWCDASWLMAVGVHGYSLLDLPFASWNVDGFNNFTWQPRRSLQYLSQQGKEILDCRASPETWIFCTEWKVLRLLNGWSWTGHVCKTLFELAPFGVFWRHALLRLPIAPKTKRIYQKAARANDELAEYRGITSVATKWHFHSKKQHDVLLYLAI